MDTLGDNSKIEVVVLKFGLDGKNSSCDSDIPRHT
jgi:hypothetical protein